MFGLLERSPLLRVRRGGADKHIDSLWPGHGSSRRDDDEHGLRRPVCLPSAVCCLAEVVSAAPRQTMPRSQHPRRARGIGTTVYRTMGWLPHILPPGSVASLFSAAMRPGDSVESVKACQRLHRAALPPPGPWLAVVSNNKREHLRLHVAVI